MARETKTLQCYPSDSKINAMCQEQESFGWELINNQRCQEEKYFGAGYTQTSTFHKLTFSREKNSPWYAEVTDLEDRYTKLMNREPTNYAKEPGKGLLFFGIVGLVLGALTLLLSFSMGLFAFVFWLPLILLVLGVLFLLIYIVKKKHYKRDYADYRSRLSEWEKSAKKEADEIRRKASAIVNA